LYIYGHTADSSGVDYGETAIRIYKEDTKSFNKYALGSVKARGNNRDGHAILACAKKIRSMNEDPGLIFVISDGAPYAIDYDGQQAIDDTRKKVNMSENLGFQVIQIAIEEYVPSEEMFNSYIKLTDMKTFPNDLIAFASKKIDKLIKTKVIY
jgi:nitric oxide reductase activation protein